MNCCNGAMVLFLCLICAVVGGALCGTIGYALGRRGRM